MRDELWYWNIIKILITNFNICNIRLGTYNWGKLKGDQLFVFQILYFHMILKLSSFSSLTGHPTHLINLHSHTILPFWNVRFLWRMNFSFKINQTESSFSPCIFSRTWSENCSGGRWYSGILRGSKMTECNCRNIDDRQL